MENDNHITQALEKCLDDLESRIEPEIEDRLLQEWVSFSEGEFHGTVFSPNLVISLLELVTETYACFIRAWIELVPFHPDGNVHWVLFHQGNIMLRDDSAMNISADMFREFIRTYDQRLLDEFGGGAIHFCGKGDHFIGELAQMKGVTAVNLSQPSYNDMELVFMNTVDLGIILLDLRRPAAESAVASGRELHGRVHSW